MALGGFLFTMLSLRKQRVEEQECVEGDDQRRYHARDGGGDGTVGETAHQRCASREHDQGYERERDAERQHSRRDDRGLGGVHPQREDGQAGAIVTARRMNNGMRRPMNPCITTWPAYVPTLELDNPDASRATANASAAAAPSRFSKPACACSMVSIALSPLPWNSPAATSSIARFTAPATLMAIITSTRTNRISSKRSRSSTGRIRSWVSAECR